ncbi:MAG TPA: hypothetical protein VNS63_07170 [Blastocatellia bacterium]|nr:hypothetical protein [Blastocatellia bacterium]
MTSRKVWCFLASDDCSDITGTELLVDGGFAQDKDSLYLTGNVRIASS